MKYCCNICGSSGKVLGSKRGVKAVQCAGCGFIWKDLTSPPKEYYGSWKISTEKNFSLRNRDEIFEYRLKTIINKTAREVKKILDFGCGKGEFVYFLRAKGYEAYGCDTGPLSPQGPFFLKQDITSVGQSGFDAIFSIEVFEHLKDPRNIMAALRERLNRNGVIYIQTHYSGINRIFSWEYFNMENHVSFYGPTAMRELMRSAGIELIHYDKKKIKIEFPQVMKNYLLDLWCRTMPYSFKNYIVKVFDKPHINRYENPPKDENYLESVLKLLNCVYIGIKK